jgi:autotransporter translocation and assembly factor TamB
VRVLGWGALLLVLLAAAVSAALRSDAGRGYLALKLSRALSAVLVGKIQIGSVRAFSGTWAVLGDVVVRDGAGRVVVRASRVEATLNLSSLLRGDVVLEHAFVDAPWVSLHQIGESLAIAQVFLPVPSAEPKREKPDGEPFFFAIRHARLRGGTVVSMPGALGAHGVEAHGTLSYSDAFRLRLKFARAQLTRAGGAELAAHVSKAGLSVREGETSYLNARLYLGADALQLAANVVWGNDGPVRADAHLQGTVSPAGLAASGLAQASALLRRPFALRVQSNWRKAQQRFVLRCDLDTAGGQVALEAARVPHGAQARLRSDALALDRVLTVPGLTTTAFDLDLRTHQVGKTRQLVLHARPLAYGPHHFPAWTARGEVDANGAHLRELAVPSFQAQRGDLRVDVRADFSGDFSGMVSARLPRMTQESRLGRLSSAQANALKLSVSAKYQAASDALLVDASGQLNSLRRGDVFVRALEMQLRAHGSLSQPRVTGELRAGGLKLGGLHIDQAALNTTGGPVHHRVTASASAGKAQARAEFTLALGASEQRLSGSGEITRWLPEPLSFRVDDLRVRPDAIALGTLRASAGSSLLAVEGTLGRTRRSDVHVRLEQLALHIPTRADKAPEATLQGHLGAHLHFAGELSEPDLELSVHVPDLALGDQAVGELFVRANLATRQRNAQAQASLNDPDGTSLQLSLNGKLPAKGALPARFKEAHYELNAHYTQPVSQLARLSGAPWLDAAADGAVELSALLSGPLESPTGRVSIKGTGLKLGETGPLDARAEAEFAYASSQLKLAVDDRHGALAKLDADLAAGLHELATALARGRVNFVPGSYHLDVSERALSELPPPLRRNEPIALGLTAELTTFADRNPHAEITAVARSIATGTLVSCSKAALPRFTLKARLGEGRADAELTGELAGRRILNATLSGPARLFNSTPALPERGYTLDVDAQAVDLAELPAVCRSFSGQVTGSLHARQLLAEHPRLEGKLTLGGLRVRGAGPLDLSLAARGDDSGLHISSAEIHQGGARTLQAEAHLPWRWDGGGKLTPDLAHCTARADLSQLELAAMLALVPAVAQPAGRASGELTLSGCQDLAGLHGHLELEHARFTLKDPLLRVDDLATRVRVSASSIAFESLRLHDQGGSLRGHGKLELKNGMPARVELALSAEEFPLRSDAKVVANLDGKLGVSVHWDAVPRRVGITLSDVSLRLPTQRGKKSQEVAQHADVIYVNSQASSAEGADAEEPLVPVELRLDSKEPFWVRRDDFGVQLEMHLRLAAGTEGVRVSGPILVRRGFINLLSKGFTIERGQLLFDGEEKIDPTVTIDAVHKLGDGQTVTVRIRERLSAPMITFATSIAGIATDAEIMQLLMRGRTASASETAQAQVGAALAGMTSELIGSLGRTKLGKYVPVLALEAGASSGTRIRAGVEANSLIPAKLRSVIEGAYVEGFVGGKNQGGNAQATGGVLVELYFPKKLVTGGTWELPNNWSLELTWEP